MSSGTPHSLFSSPAASSRVSIGVWHEAGTAANGGPLHSRPVRCSPSRRSGSGGSGGGGSPDCAMPQAAGCAQPAARILSCRSAGGAAWAPTVVPSSVEGAPERLLGVTKEREALQMMSIKVQNTTGEFHRRCREASASSLDRSHATWELVH